METEPRLEQELKIPVEALKPLRSRLESLGAELVAGREREENHLLDTPERTLQRSGRTLRVRRLGDRCLLTLKGQMRWNGAVKERDELETVASSAATVLAILRQLGYSPTFRYDKNRERWRLGRVEVDLDELPIGAFVELEGPADELDAAARSLGLDPTAAVRGSYASLWASRRQADPSLPRDMVFEP